MQRKPNIVHIDALDNQQALHSSFTVGNDIIDYIEPARTFGRDDLMEPTRKGRFQQRMVALPDRRGPAVQPMVLTLGKGNRLSLVRRDADSSAGWARIALREQVVAFAAAWATVGGKELTTLAVALDDGAGASRLLVAYDFDAQQADWSHLQWTDYGVRDGLVIDALRLLRGADGLWTVFMSAATEAAQDVYLVRSDKPASLSKHSLVFSLVRDEKEVLDFNVGLLAREPVLHVLGIGHFNNQRLLGARAIPSFENGMPSTEAYPFECPAGGRVLAMGQTRKQGTDLYVAGKGVWRLPAEQLRKQDDGVFEPVIAASLASDVLKLSVCEAADGGTSAWALRGDGTLLMAHRTSLAEPWGEATAVRQQVVDLAPVVGDDQLTSGVLVVYENGLAGHLWRSTDGLWQETAIRVADPEASSSITCFSTNISVLDHGGIPRGDTTVQLRTSVLSTLVVNGRSLFVGPDDPVQVKTDLSGNLRIFNRALSFTPASYELALDGLAAVLEINPAAPLYQRFSQMTATELQQAELGGGQGSLLPQALRGKEGARTVETMLLALKQAALLVGGDQASGVRLRAAAKGFSGALDSRHVADDFRLAVASDAHGQLRTAAAVGALPGAAAAVLPGFGQSLSDFLESLCCHAESAVSFVIHKVRGAVEFVCEVAGKVKRFVLDTLESIGGFFSWLWQKVTAGVDKVWSFVKFLFDWGDITAVRTTMADFIDEELTVLVKRISSLRSTVTPAFDHAIAAIEAQCVALGVSPEKSKVLLEPGTGEVTQAQRKAPNQDQDASRSGPGAGMGDLLGSIIELVVKVEMPPPSQEFGSLFDLFDQQLDELSGLGTDIKESFKHIFAPDGFTLADLDLDKIKRILYSLVLNLAKRATAMTRNLVVHLIDQVAALVDLMRRILFSTIRFPFIEKTFALLTGEPLDTGVRLIDIVLFVPAVLGTITYKLFMGSSPLKPVLASRPPLNAALALQPSVALAAQPSATPSAFDYLKDVVSTYIGMGMMSMGMASASTGAKAQKATKPLQCLLLAGKTGLLLLKTPWRTGDAPINEVDLCRHTTFFIGVTGVAFKGWHLYQGRKNGLSAVEADNVASTLFAAAVEMLLTTLQSSMKVVTLAYDKQANGWETLQYVARNSAQTAYKACLFLPDPVSRTKVMVVATAGGFTFDYLVGLVRHGVQAPRI